MAIARKNKDGEWVVGAEISVSRYDLEGAVDEIKSALDVMRNSAVAMGMVSEGRVDISTERSYYSDDYEVKITYYFDRYEYPAEKEKREAMEAKVKADAKAKRKATAEKKKLKDDPEYAEFERLKAKFGV